MRKTSLLLIRMPVEIAAGIARNPAVRERFNSIYLHVGRTPELNDGAFREVIAITATARKRKEAKWTIIRAIEKYKITHVISMQPLLWYTDIVKIACEERGAKLLYLEGFPGGMNVYDTIGSQYCEDNEILKYASTCTREFEVPDELSTRQPQPAERDARSLYSKYAPPNQTVVVFGQVEHDLSLVDRPGASYGEWMYELVRRNPKITFLVKDHPLITSRGGVSDVADYMVHNYPNTMPFNESVVSALNAYHAFAAFSSTTILEGTIRDKVFITGGRHFLSDPDPLVPEAHHPEDLDDAYYKIIEHQFDRERLRRRLGFLTGLYAMKEDDPRLLDKILMTPDEFYAKHGR